MSATHGRVPWLWPMFLMVFAGVLARHGGKRRAAEHAACAQLPLADDAGHPGAGR